MQISSLIDIVEGDLLNSPFISFIYSFKTDPLKVKEGDLFIAKDTDNIPLAVQNGAFAILMYENHPIIDNEIAWIKVKDIDLAVVQLIRFKLANYNLEAYYTDCLTFDLLNVFSQSSTKSIRFIGDINSFIKTIDEIEENDILVSKNKSILDKIYPDNRYFNEYRYDYENLVRHSLFEISFTHNDVFFSKLKIPTIYIEEFLAVYNFLDLPLDYSKLKNISHFKPIFLDKSLDIIEFGKSDKFLICQNDDNLMIKELDYLEKNFKYAKKMYITNSYKNFLDDKQIVVDSIDEIREILKINSFNLVYIIGFEYLDVYTSLEGLEKQPTLF